jgi:diguanylate cyclase (GGDEF)-like protein/PAS domain S-box-containing protein
MERNTMKPTLDINLCGLNVLVVEDDVTSALLTSRILSKQGAHVESATSGRAGLEKFEQQRFPIIVTDINMPGMNGLEMVDRIRELDQSVQFIATSANRDVECIVSAIGLGFSDYFLKPLEIEKLILAVKRCGDVIAARKELEDEQRKFQAVVESLGEGIAIKDLDFKILYQNKAMTKMFGDRTGLSCFKVFGYEEPCTDCPTYRTLEDGHPHSACRNLQLNGTTMYIESTASLIRDSLGTVTGAVEIIRDISERIKNEETIRNLAFHDPLTGLANRRLFEDRLNQAIAKSHRYGMKFGLVTLDLDNFKDINDSLGHEAGDQVLVEAGERIRTCCKRDLDTISRQGGDEFSIIITDCDGREHLTSLADKILEQFSRPFLLSGVPVAVTTSIGISVFPDNSPVMKELEIASDRAMYAAKKAGKNTYKFSPFEASGVQGC